MYLTCAIVYSEKVSEALKSDFLFGTLGWEVRERYEEHKQFNKNVWLVSPEEKSRVTNMIV